MPIDYGTLAFVDCETSGLDLYRHQIWEVGIIVDDDEWTWTLPIDLGLADPAALRVGGYYERSHDNERATYYSGATGATGFMSGREIATRIARLTRGRALVGANVSFDMYRLDALLRDNNACPDWHYRPIDVEALAVGCMLVKPTVPWKGCSEIATLLGLNLADFDVHTALGDARLAKAIYEAVMA